MGKIRHFHKFHRFQGCWSNGERLFRLDIRDSLVVVFGIHGSQWFFVDPVFPIKCIILHYPPWNRRAGKQRRRFLQEISFIIIINLIIRYINFFDATNNMVLMKTKRRINKETQKNGTVQNMRCKWWRYLTYVTAHDLKKSCSR